MPASPRMRAWCRRKSTGACCGRARRFYRRKRSVSRRRGTQTTRSSCQRRPTKMRTDMSEATQPRYGIDPYLEWVKKEGLPVAEDYALDLFAVPTADWPRFGVKGAVAHLKGRGDFCNMFVLELPPGKSTI